MKFDSYRDLPRIWGFDVVVWEEESNYQGDTLAVLRNGCWFGFLAFGWGSCPGCDALLSCGTEKDYADLASQLHSSIQWYDSLAAMREAMDARDWEASCFVAELVRRFRKTLETEGGSMMEEAMVGKTTKTEHECDHGVTFDEAKAEDMTTEEIRKRWPRGWFPPERPCPTCGFVGIAYASTAHSVYGDW